MLEIYWRMLRSSCHSSIWQVQNFGTDTTVSSVFAIVFMFTTNLYPRLGSFFAISSIIEGGLTVISTWELKTRAIVGSVIIITFVVSTELFISLRSHCLLMASEWVISLVVDDCWQILCAYGNNFAAKRST